MYLKSLKAKDFRKFKEMSVNFPSDITVVRGPNEKGKSTLLLAILAGLFYDPKKSNKDIDALKSWDSERMYELVLEIEHEGQEIVLFKDFEGHDMYLENKTTGKRLDTYKEISDYLFDIAALRSVNLFENTACVKHDALSLVTQGGRDISQALQSMLTSTVETVSPERIIKKAQAGLLDIQKGLKSASKTPGLLKSSQDRIEELKKEKEKAKSEIDELSKKVDYFGSLTHEYNKLKKELDVKDRQYQMNQQYFKALEALNNLNNEYEKIEKDHKELSELEKGKEYVMAKLEHMIGLKGFNFKEFNRANAVLKQKMAELEYIKKEKSANGSSNKKKGGKKALFLNLAVFFLLVGAGGFFYKELYAAWALALLFLFLSVFLKGEKRNVGKMDLNAGFNKLQADISELSLKIKEVYKQNGVRNEDELIDKIKQYNELCQDLAKIESKEEGILRDSSKEIIEKERAELLKKIGIEQERITDEQKQNVPTVQEQRLLEIDIEKIKMEIDGMSKDMARASAFSNQYNADSESLAKIEEELEALEEKNTRYEKRAKILEALSDNIKEAQASVISKSKSHIEDYMKRYLSVITDGRYDNVKVNDDLSFYVWSNEKKSMIVPEEHLSQGTIDQFYLVARFAILDVLNKGKKSIMLLDDPFHAFDKGRRDKTKDVLRDLTQKFQIVLFTHSSDYDDFGTVVEI